MQKYYFERVKTRWINHSPVNAQEWGVWHLSGCQYGNILISDNRIFDKEILIFMVKNAKLNSFFYIQNHVWGSDRGNIFPKNKTGKIDSCKNFFPSSNWVLAETVVKHDKGAQHYLSVRTCHLTFVTQELIKFDVNPKIRSHSKSMSP